MRSAAIPILLLAFAACSRPMPPNGTTRLTLSGGKTSPGVRLHQSRSEIVMTFDHAGTRKFLEYEVETWIGGAPQAKPRASRNVIDGPHHTFRISVTDGTLKGKKAYSFDQEFKQSKFWGGEAAQGSAFSVPAPEGAAAWTATLFPAASMDVPDVENTAIWGIFMHREKLDLPAGSSLQAWAAKADAALLYRIRLTD